MQIYPRHTLLLSSSKQKEQDVNPEQFLRLSGDGYKTRVIYGVYKEYRRRLTKTNTTMDFDVCF